MQLSGEELARYSRQIILSELGRDGQQKLKEAKVLIVGMGGLGSPSSLYLAAAGVGQLTLADFDEVELHNLHRQVLHATKDIGRAKIDSAAEKLEALNPHCQLHKLPQGVKAEELPDLFKEYDIILDGSDNFTTRYMVNDACVLAERPLCYGSIFQFEGQASLFAAHEGTACYRCLFPQMPDPSTVPNCAEAGVIGALCGIIGSIQALEAVKYLTGAGENLRNRLMVADVLRMRMRTLNIKKDPACPVCGTQRTIRAIKGDDYIWKCAVGEPKVEAMEISPKETKELMAAGSALVVDVREPFELDICQIRGAINIPLQQLPARAGELPRDRPLITVCHHGMRSLAGVKELKARGFKDVRSMRGGVDAWATDVDPAMERY